MRTLDAVALTVQWLHRALGVIDMGVSAKELGLEELPVEDKLALINELWEGIVASEVPVPISDELASEIERRLARYRADPSTARSAEEVRRAGYAAANEG